MGVLYAMINDLRKHDERMKLQKDTERKQLEDFKKQQDIFKGIQDALVRFLVVRAGVGR